MEVKSNLVAEDRAVTLRKFGAACFKKVAHVVMGDPSEDFSTKARTKILKDKQAKSDATWKAQKLDEKRKKEVAKKQKALAKMREAEAAKKKAVEDKKKEEEAAKKKAE